MLDPAQALAFWAKAVARFALQEEPVDGQRVLELAIQAGCSSYDAAFVVLACCSCSQVWRSRQAELDGLAQHQPEWNAAVEPLKQRLKQLSAADATISGWADGMSCALAPDPSAAGGLRRAARRGAGVITNQQRYRAPTAGLGYWWVNHKQTSRQETDGGYVWSPKANANGARNVSYDNPTRCQRGDVVFSYAFGRISQIGLGEAAAVTEGWLALAACRRFWINPSRAAPSRSAALNTATGR